MKILNRNSILWIQIAPEYLSRGSIDSILEKSIFSCTGPVICHRRNGHCPWRIFLKSKFMWILQTCGQLEIRPRTIDKLITFMFTLYSYNPWWPPFPPCAPPCHPTRPPPTWMKLPLINEETRPIKLWETHTPPWKCSPLKNIHTWKIFSPRKYSVLENIHPWKIFTTEKYLPLKMIHPC